MSIVAKKILKNKLIFCTRTGAIELLSDYEEGTVWANLAQIAKLFAKDKSVISRHINKIYKNRELNRKATVAFFATVRIEGKRRIYRKIEFYNLDLIISVGYRVNSRTATKFRQWATQILHQHILEGFTINQSRLEQNKKLFLQTLEKMKSLLPANSDLTPQGALELMEIFAATWFSLRAYDGTKLPKSGQKIASLDFSCRELVLAWQKFKIDLINRGQAGPLFGQEVRTGVFLATLQDVFQTYQQRELYLTLEEKAAHLLYFVVKNHPFVDGNKRSGAFIFVWFLRQVNLLDTQKISPAALTALTLLIAESDPRAKAKMIGLVLLMLMR